MNEFTVVLSFGEFNYAINYCEDGVVLTNINTIAGVEIGTALANDEVAADGAIATEYLYT